MTHVESAVIPGASHYVVADNPDGVAEVTSQVPELSYVHSRDVTFAVFCQGPYEESARYRAFKGWEMPWYSVKDSLGTLLAPPKRPGRMHLVCYLRKGSIVCETYWTTIRGVEAMDNNYRLLDLTVYGRQGSVACDWHHGFTCHDSCDAGDYSRTARAGT